MNSAPMIFLFLSGSSTPASLSRKRSTASTYTRLASIWLRKTSTTCSGSPFLRSPWFTWTHTRFLPIARMSRAEDLSVSDLLPDLCDFLVYECLGELGGVDPMHVVRALVAVVSHEGCYNFIH